MIAFRGTATAVLICMLTQLVAPAYAADEPELAPGFLLELRSSQDQKLNGSFRIQKDGRVQLPYSVTIDTDGMTLGQFRAEIRKAYKPYFRTQADVSVQIQQKRYWIEIRGLVSSPGPQLIKENATLDDVITLAGGIGEEVSSGYVKIERRAGEAHWVDLDEYFKRGRLAELPSWEGGERVFFQKERPAGTEGTLLEENLRNVHVLGEVRQPGELSFRKGADAYYYLIKTGGPTQAADLTLVEQIRTDPLTGRRDRIELGHVSGISDLKEGDILIFHPDRPSGFQRFLQSTSLIAGIVSATLLAVIAAQSLRR